MRILPPTPEISLYHDGFENHDSLSRRRDSERLSHLFERIEDLLVVALDGNWGSGKTFFLKCWVGAHTKENLIIHDSHLLMC